MDSDPDQTRSAADPASAFAELRGEVSLLRRAIEGLTAERQNAPDYTPTLKVHSNRLAQIEGLLGAIAERPAMRLTPEALAASIATASETVRAGDRNTIRQASGVLRMSITAIDSVVEQARTADRQWRWLCWTAVGSLLVGATGTVLLLHLIG
ncbi:MAG TPA: hypothetical protein VFT56_17240 [Sphingomonas sp.]|nr:hypothetical protein [Sphingomonas sp.]